MKEDFFPVMGEALMEALNQLLGDKLTSDMKDAWVIVYDALSSEMIRSMNNDKSSKNPGTKILKKLGVMCLVDLLPK